LTLKRQGTRIGVHAGEPLVDDGPGAVVGGREQVCVDPEGKGRVGVAEVLGQFVDGDASGEHDAGVVVTQLVDALFARGGVADAGAPVLIRFRDESGPDSGVASRRSLSSCAP
jgi:hypothetical protein